jgi:hypothetical protein
MVRKGDCCMSMAEFDKYEKEISDAMQEGRITK